jgi:hypothetical protein
MSAKNKSGRRAGQLGLVVGFGVAVWFAVKVASQVGAASSPPPSDSNPPAPRPANPPAALPGQLGNFGQLGQPGGQPVLFGMYGQSFQPAALPVVAPKDSKAKVEEFRKRYPFESLTDRLDYEPEGAAAFTKSYPPPRVTKETLARLAGGEKEMEHYWRGSLRSQALKLLHSETAEKFIEVRDDFGLSRLPHVPVPTTVYLALAAAPSVRCAEVREAARAGVGDAADVPKAAALSEFHERGLRDFLDPVGFGYVKDREHVAGFQGHQFRQMPQLPIAHKPPDEAKEQWAVVRLQLVSLLKYGRPAVYISDNLPRMDELKGVPTRPLIAFEEKGLKSLREGDDLATETSGDRIRMVGSLRASKQCLECHEVKRGDLLGAFSWELQRQPVYEKK